MLDSKALFEYSNDIKDVWKGVEEYDSRKKRKVLIVFDDIIAVMIGNKKLQPLLLLSIYLKLKNYINI